MLNWSEIEPNVDKAELDDREIYLVGTAHVSAQSTELVRRLIHDLKPDGVAVELCEGRYRSLKEPDRWKNTNIVTVIRQGRTYVLLAQLILAAYQRKLGSQLNIKPGAEMMAAVHAAEEVSAQCVMADRDINVTLRRAWSQLGMRAIFKLTYSTITSMFEKAPQVTEAEIERLKNSDALTEVMKEFSAALPEVRAALIDERDQYLAQKIRNTPGKRVLAVVGAAHVPGIKNWITKPIDITKIEQLPKKKLSTTIIGWAFPVCIIGGMIYSFFASGSETFTEMFKTWFWFTGLFGALGAAVVRAHPLTTLSAFIAAPFASLNPFIAAGWVAGLVEAAIRKPRVGDLESIVDDMSTVRGALSNRVSRTLLIVASTNIFVMLGMGIAAKQVYTIAADAHAKEISSVTDTMPSTR